MQPPVLFVILAREGLPLPYLSSEAAEHARAEWGKTSPALAEHLTVIEYHPKAGHALATELPAESCLVCGATREKAPATCTDAGRHEWNTEETLRASLAALEWEMAQRDAKHVQAVGELRIQLAAAYARAARSIEERDAARAEVLARATSMREQAAKLIEDAVPVASKDRRSGEPSPWSTLIACASNVRSLTP